MSRHTHHPSQGYGVAQPESYRVVELGEGVYDDARRQSWATEAFIERSRRMVFVRKVLGTVGIQLAFCAVLTAVFLRSGDGGKKWIYERYWIGLLAGILWLTINIAVSCCNVGRGPPSCCNISLLIVGTTCLSILCAFITIRYDQNVVLYAMATTVGTLLVIIIITSCTKIDITGWGIYLMVGGIVLLISSLVIGIIFAVDKSISKETRGIVFVVFSFIFVFLLCFYILYDLQLIVGGRRHQLDEEDWLFACLVLFGDIVYLFLQLLQIFQYFQNG